MICYPLYLSFCNSCTIPRDQRSLIRPFAYLYRPKELDKTNRTGTVKRPWRERIKERKNWVGAPRTKRTVRTPSWPTGIGRRRRVPRAAPLLSLPRFIFARRARLLRSLRSAALRSIAQVLAISSAARELSSACVEWRQQVQFRQLMAQF